VGSYGTIDKETGEFQSEGSIYDEEAKFDFGGSDRIPQPEEHEHTDDLIVSSWDVTYKTLPVV